MKTGLAEKLTLILVILCLAAPASAGVPPRPSPPRLVNDLANVFTQEQVDAMEMRLVALDDSTSNQIAVVTVLSLDGMAPADYALEIHRTWGVGQKDKNNGIVILYKPKTPDESGKVFISVGYGLEGAVPDATANRIVEDEMVPEFKEGNVYAGFTKALDVLIPIVSGEISASDYDGGGDDAGGIVALLVFLFCPLGFIIYLVIRNIRRAILRRHGITPAEDWIDRANRGGGNDHTHGGGWIGGGGFGGGFGGGGGGGGFGGFGGGSAGGGGAGGSW